jgi:sugar/nucleoside kinase (ribokinase family)
VTAAGDSWRSAPLYGFLQGKVRKRLTKRSPAIAAATADPRSIEALSEAWELRSAYPIRGLEMEGQLTAELHGSGRAPA